MMFARELFGLIQLSDSFVDVFHGCYAVSAPFSAGVFEIIAGSLQGTTGGIDFGRHVLWRGA
jgi:hypothetical protein